MRRKSHLGLVLIAGLIPWLLAGCSTSKVVTRTDPDAQIDLSGNWNDSDSRQMAGALVDDMLNGTAWLETHMERAGSRPAVIVGEIKNRTDEHIPMKTLAKVSSVEAPESISTFPVGPELGEWLDESDQTI